MLAAVPEGHREGQTSSERQSHSKQRFLSALAAYKSQQYETAQKELEPLAKLAPGSFEINELLGLVYVAQGKQEQANSLLAKAVRLRPNVAEARTALATNLLALHRVSEAQTQFRSVVALEPQSYDANHNLGEFYIETGSVSQAIPFLRRAQEIDPAAYNNGYDLSLALEQVGRLDDARRQLEKLVTLHDSAELHGLLGEVEEKSGDYVSAVRQYEQAARMQPNEQNILNWGAELILHQTFAPAIEVFRAGTHRFSLSAHLYEGLGIALYGAGQTDDAVGAFFQASDLDPSNSLPVSFLGKACDGASPALAAQVEARLQAFISRNPRNAEVAFYDATCLRRVNSQSSEANMQVESLLRRVLALNPNYADAYFQLGILYADQRRYAEAIDEYERALKLNPTPANIHYRLGQALARAGNGARAQEEFSVFERLRGSESQAANQEQSQIQQFVYTIRNAGGDQP